MARWISKITNAGLTLLARTPNNNFVFTKAECGSGTVNAAVLETQTQVTNFKKSLLISGCTSTNNQVSLRVQLNNENISTGFLLHQIGIYAKLATDSTDILFMILQTDLADFIPSLTESPNYVCDYVVSTVVSNASSITANVDPAGYVTQGQLEEILAGLEDVELKDNVEQIKQEIGITTDTGGSSTAGSVFAKLNYLVSQVSSYLSSVYSWVTKIGNTADTGGTSTAGTVMAKENMIIEQLGITTDTGATTISGTVMGKLNNMLELKYRPVIKFQPGVLTVSLASSALVRFATSEKIYVAGDKIYSYNAETLEKIGETETLAGNCSCMYVSDGKIYCADYTTKKVTIYNEGTGIKLGETAVQSSTITAMFVSNGRLFCSVLSTRVAVFDSSTFALLGNISVSPLGDRIFVYEDILYVSTSSGIKLYNAATRVLITTINSGYSIEHLFIDNGIIFFTDYGTNAKKVYLYDVATRLKIGEIAAVTTTDTEHCMRLYAYDDTIYFGASDGHIYLLDIPTLTKTNNSFSIYKGQVYIEMSNRSAYWYDPSGNLTKLSNQYQISHYDKEEWYA